MNSPDLAAAPHDGVTFVLVVEDEFLVRFSIADELRAAGMTVIEAANAAEAWTYLASGGRADLVFSDIQMPGEMNGIDLARRLRDAYPAIPLILTSGNIPAERVDGLAPFIRKPYRSAVVMSVIAETLKQDR
jgi:two-component system, response regulator PdtaR